MECKFCSKKFTSELRYKNHEKTCSDIVNNIEDKIDTDIDKESMKKELLKLRREIVTLKMRIDDNRVKMASHNKTVKLFQNSMKRLADIINRNANEDEKSGFLKQQILKLEEENLKYKLELDLQD